MNIAKIKRIQIALKETNRYIAREERRPQDTRPIATQVILNDAVQHRIYLENMISGLQA